MAIRLKIAGEIGEIANYYAKWQLMNPMKMQKMKMGLMGVGTKGFREEVKPEII